MKQLLKLLCAACLLAGCGSQSTAASSTPTAKTQDERTVAALGDSKSTATEKPVTESKTTAAPKSTAAAPSNETEIFENDYIYMSIPKGWNVNYYYSNDGGWWFEVINPSAPDMQYFYLNRMEPFFVSEEARNTWASTVNSALKYAPVIDSPTATSVIYAWAEFQNYVANSGYGDSPIPSITNVNVTQSSNYEGNYTQYGANESDAMGTATGPNGSDCVFYLCNAVIETVEPIRGYVSNYYSAYANYGILAPTDDWNSNYEFMITCLMSTQLKDTDSNNSMAGIGVMDQFILPEFHASSIK